MGLFYMTPTGATAAAKRGPHDYQKKPTLLGLSIGLFYMATTRATVAAKRATLEKAKVAGALEHPSCMECVQ